VVEDRDLYSGLIRLHVLHHACEEPIFGLGMIELLARHGYHISPGSLYPLLQGLEKKGYLRSTEVRNGKSLRRVYRATPLGHKALAGAKQKIRESSTKLWKGVDPCHDSFGASRLRPIIVAGRPAASLCGGHPRRRPTTALALASGDALQHDDGLFDMFALVAEIGEHLQDVHG
jgi:DNA-binding PadR family transcriptional regulator